MSKNNRHRTLIIVTTKDIWNGQRTITGNPVCRAIRSQGWQGARVDGSFLHLYRNRHWTLTILPLSARAFLMRWLKRKPCKPMRFEIKHAIPVRDVTEEK